MASSAYTAPTDSPLKVNCSACSGDCVIFQATYARATVQSTVASSRVWLAASVATWPP